MGDVKVLKTQYATSPCSPFILQQILMSVLIHQDVLKTATVLIYLAHTVVTAIVDIR